MQESDGEQQIHLSSEQAMKELGITKLRQLQLMAQKGRIHRITLPRVPGAPGKPASVYTAESIEIEKARRAAGERGTRTMPTIPYVPPPQLALSTVAVAHVDAFTKLCTALTEQLPQLPKLQQTAADSPDDAYLTVEEAAAVKRMPESWILNQIAEGRLPYELTARGGKRILRGDLRNLVSRLTQTRTSRGAA